MSLSLRGAALDRRQRALERLGRVLLASVREALAELRAITAALESCPRRPVRPERATLGAPQTKGVNHP